MSRQPVKACVTTSAKGDVAQRLIVFCRERGSVIPFEECADCARCSGWVLDEGRAHSFVLCEPNADDETEPDGEPVDELDALLGTPVRDVMTLGVRCVATDLPLPRLLTLLAEAGVSGAPVVDESGRPLGMVSQTDVVRACAAQAAGQDDVRGGAVRSTVQDIMTPLCFTLREQTPLAHAAALMAYEGVHRAPVLDAEGRVTGIVSSFDVMRRVALVAGHRP